MHARPCLCRTIYSMSRPACKLSSINTPRKLRIQRFYINLRCRIKFLTTQHCLVEEKWNGRRSFKKHFQISHTPSFFAQQALHQKLKNLSDGTNTKNQVQHLRVFCKTDSLISLNIYSLLPIYVIFR